MSTHRTEQRIETDLLVVGGGINGVGIARDAAGRGLDVVLCERDDLAQATSSASTKLIHGGLRYLEHYEFALVRDALREREVLLASAPHIIWPLRFVLPHHRALRPRWLIRLGLFLYDHIGGRRLLPPSRGITFARHPAGTALKPSFRHGFEYSDCWVQDSRLVVLNARDAATHGATILTRHACVGLERDAGRWQARLVRAADGAEIVVTARAVANAAGPWVEQVSGLAGRRGNRRRVRLVKGSHVVVPRLFEHAFPYIFQHRDGRVLFAIPYEHDYTLLGTTDTPIDGDPGEVSADAAEIDYICDAVGEYLRVPVRPEDVLWSYAGVRPLLDDEADDPSKVTRDYVLEMERDGAPLLTVYGGKITTYRKLAERAVDLLAEPLDLTASAWTARATLPGGGFANGDFEAFVVEAQQRHPWLEPNRLTDYARNYGSEMHQLLDDCHAMDDLGRDFGGGLYEAEVRFLRRFEWAERASDVLWRRTKKGLCMDEEQREAFRCWFEDEAQLAVGAH